MKVRAREATALALAGITFIAGVSADPSVEWVLGGAIVGLLIGLGLPWLFGAPWRDAGAVLGAAVAVPWMCVPINASSGVAELTRFTLPALSALPLAHLLARRHSNARTATTLFVGSVSLAVAVAGTTALLHLVGVQGHQVLGLGHDPRYWLLGGIALLPGAGIAFGGEARPRPGGVADRIGAVAIGATPGAAMTVLLPFVPNPMLFVGWIALLVLWRRFSVAPLLRIAQRTQRQRDLAVAAAEAERARLASDLHDDALQELTALVRRLDAAGDTEGAEQARGIAERLRAICSDLRLPLLDDLGAGPALEWLVARVRPLVDGEVSLDCADLVRPPADVELAVFRVAQQALANAVQHGRTPIKVRYVVNQTGGVRLSVDDAGAGIDSGALERALQTGHFGIAGMYQRAEQIGGLLDVRGWPGGGTCVALQWQAR